MLIAGKSMALLRALMAAQGQISTFQGQFFAGPSRASPFSAHLTLTSSYLSPFSDHLSP